MLITFTIFTVLSAVYLEGRNSESVGRTVIAFIFIFFFFYDIGVTPLTFGESSLQRKPGQNAGLTLSQPTQQKYFPSTLAKKVIAFTNMCNTVALTFNTFVNPIALQAISWKYYLVYIVLLVLMTTIVYLFFAETKGLSLEEISKVFDDPAIVTGWHRRRHRSDEVGESHGEPHIDTDDAVKEITEHCEKIQA